MFVCSSRSSITTGVYNIPLQTNIRKQINEIATGPNNKTLTIQPYICYVFIYIRRSIYLTKYPVLLHMLPTISGTHYSHTYSSKWLVFESSVVIQQSDMGPCMTLLTRSGYCCLSSSILHTTHILCLKCVIYQFLSIDDFDSPIAVELD